MTNDRLVEVYIGLAAAHDRVVDRVEKLEQSNKLLLDIIEELVSQQCSQNSQNL